MRDTFSGSRAYNQAGFVRQRATALSSRMTFPEALTEAMETGCAIRPVGERDTCLLVKPQGVKGEPFMYMVALGVRQGSGPRVEPGAYVRAGYYLLPWEVCPSVSTLKRGDTLSDLFPELLTSDGREPKFTLFDIGHVPAKEERKWKLSDLF